MHIRNTIILCSICICVVLTQPHGGHHGKKGGAWRNKRLDAFKKALTSCQADVARFCSSSKGTFMQVRCLAMQSSNLSPTCKTALFAAIRRPHHGPSPPSTSAGQDAIDNNCLRSVVKKCMPATIETMLDPDATNGADLITCAKAHSKTTSATCEIVVARMAKDGFAQHLFTCGQSALTLCSAQTIQLMGAEMGTTPGPLLAAKVMAWVKCMQPKTSQLSSTCRILVQALDTAKSKILPQQKKGTTGAGSPSLSREGYAAEDDDVEEEGSPAAAIAIGVSVFALFVLALAAATFYWKRRNQTLRARQAGIDFSRLEDEEALTGGAAAPVVVNSLPGGATVVAGTPVM